MFKWECSGSESAYIYNECCHSSGITSVNMITVIGMSLFRSVLLFEWECYCNGTACVVMRFPVLV